MSLLTEPVLIVDQVTSFMSNDFEILDAEGEAAGTIRTGGSGLSRFFMGSRQLSVLDQEGALQVYVDDVVSLGRDLFELTGPTGQRLATLHKEFRLFVLELSIEATGGPMQATGDFFEWNFEVSRPDRQIAMFQRTYAGIGRALLGHNRYVITFDPEASADERRITLGIAVAIDLIRAKQKRSAAASS